MKKYLLGIVAMVMAIGFSAFTVNEPVKASAGEKWFVLNMGGDSNKASDYTLFGDGSTEPECTGQHVCAKLAIPNPGFPETPNLGTVIDTRYRPNK